MMQLVEDTLYLQTTTHQIQKQILEITNTNTLIDLQKTKENTNKYKFKDETCINFVLIT